MLWRSAVMEHVDDEAGLGRNRRAVEPGAEEEHALAELPLRSLFKKAMAA